MTIIYYNTPANIKAGITLKNTAYAEQFNVALHTCTNPQAIIENREKLAVALNTPLEHFVFAHQTHSDQFVKVQAAHKGRGTTSQETAIQAVDALYTFEPNIVCTSFTADCVPITFYSEEHHLVGAVHSGWGGTVKEISYKLFAHLLKVEQVDLSTVNVHIGRALSQEKFEVDADVAEQFKALGYADEWIMYKPEKQKFFIDNQLVVAKQCQLAGIDPKQITIDRTCTFIDADSFSYRQDRSCGRHVSFIVREEE